jgi:spore coat polysaccharide biosynthesis protein SpsF
MSTKDHGRTIAIIQARRASTRLPDKVLLDLAGQPMLVRVVERTSRAKTIDGILVATTMEPDDQAIVALCQAHGYPCYRGSMFDVLDRYYQAATQAEADIIVRITADCPVIDPHVIDETVQALGMKSYDFAANRLPPPWGRTYPIGLDTEACTFKALEIAWKEARELYQREHVMPFMYENARVFDIRGQKSFPSLSPNPRFSAILLNNERDYGALRWTVDTPDDLELVRQIYQRFPGRDDFTWLEILELLEKEPALSLINAQVKHKSYLELDQRSVKR